MIAMNGTPRIVRLKTGSVKNVTFRKANGGCGQRTCQKHKGRAPIELDPTDAGLWRRRSHANTIAPTPRPQKGVEDATRAIELDPDHAMGYGQRAIALTQLPTPDWDSALADMDRHIELFQGHDPKAYKLRARIHENLGNHEEAKRDRQLAR